MRKEGHTKIIEYSLTAKQQVADDVMGIQRTNILLATSHAKKEARHQSLKRKANGKRSRHDSDGESSEGYNDKQFDSDADSDEQEAPNGRAATPADSSDDEEEHPRNGEAQEDNRMDLDEEDEEDLEADLARVEVTGTAGQIKDPASGRARQTERMMTADEARKHLRLLFENEREICSLVYGTHGPLPSRNIKEAQASRRGSKGVADVSPDMFFLDVVTVPPSRFRPAASMGDMLFESPQNELLSNVVSIS